MYGDLNPRTLVSRRRVLMQQIIVPATTTGFVTFSGLNAANDGGYYEIEGVVINNTASAGDLSIRFNGATGNYYRLYREATGAVTDTNPFICYFGVTAGAVNKLKVMVHQPLGAKVIAVGQGRDLSGAWPSQNQNNAVAWNSNDVINSIGFALAAAGMRAGSVLNIYKMAGG